VWRGSSPLIVECLRHTHRAAVDLTCADRATGLLPEHEVDRVHEWWDDFDPDLSEVGLHLFIRIEDANRLLRSPLGLPGRALEYPELPKLNTNDQPLGAIGLLRLCDSVDTLVERVSGNDNTAFSPGRDVVTIVELQLQPKAEITARLRNVLRDVANVFPRKPADGNHEGEIDKDRGDDDDGDSLRSTAHASRYVGGCCGVRRLFRRPFVGTGEGCAALPHLSPSAQPEPMYNAAAL
jgi:hypothetical protein